MGVVQPLQTVKHSRVWHDATRRSWPIVDKMKFEGFSTFNGWLQSFKKQHNLPRMNTAGEDGDVNEKVLENWSERVREITREYKPEEVWNMDETGCFWKGLPDTSMNGKGY